MESVADIRVRLHVAERDLSRPRIALLSGVNRHWLEKFSQGVIENPTYRNLEALRLWLDRYRPAESGAGAPAEARAA